MSRSADSRVTKRYASALFNSAQKMSLVEEVQKDLDTLSGLWKATPALQRAMESPLVPADKKLSLVEKLFAKEIGALTHAFVNVLIEKDREEILVDVQREFRLQADTSRGLLRAQAIVAAPMDDSMRQALVAGLQSRTGKTIALDVEVDAAILGGVVVRLQDTVIDGSVRGTLERLREQMLADR